MPEIYFVRHGESQANLDGVVAGWRDSPLTEKGLLQATEEANMIAGQALKFDYIFTSPLSRAYDTATIIAEAIEFPKRDIVVMDDLKEKHGGKFEGQPINSLQVATPEEVQGAGAETFDEFARRVERVNGYLSRLGTASVLIVGHSGFYRMAKCLNEGLRPSEMVAMERPQNGKLLLYPHPDNSLLDKPA